MILFLIITIIIVGVFLYWFNSASVPVVAWVKWMVNAIICIALLLYAANVLFGYKFPGMR